MSLKTCGVAPAMALAGAIFFMVVVSCPACAEDGVNTGCSVYTTVQLNGNGDGHVDQLIIISDVTQSPIAVGALTVNLLKGNAPWDVLVSPRNYYHNVSVKRQDGTPVDYSFMESGDNVKLEIFSSDLLMTHWNTQLVVSYDVENIISNNLLTSEFGFSGLISDAMINECQLKIVLPDGSHVAYCSPGATVDGNVISWSGPAANNIGIEYSRLPLPATPLPLQYLFWGGLTLVALAWCFKPRMPIRWRNEDHEVDSGVAPVDGYSDVLHSGDGFDGE